MSNQARFCNLLEPLQIGKLKLKNRMVKAAFSSGTADHDGFVTESLVSFYRAIAKGGIGLSIIESCAIDIMALSGRPRLVVFDDKFIPGLATLATGIHEFNCPAFLQLHHAGPAYSTGTYGGQGFLSSSYQTTSLGASSLSADEVPTPLQNLPRAITSLEIEEIVQKFANGAERAQKAGFDGVELHFGHTYLVNSFLSRAWNKRQDEYGGDIENRVRFATEIIEAVKRRVKPDFIVGTRINGQEFGHEQGLTLTETKEIARILEEAGVNYISVTGWGYGAFEQLCNFPEQILYPEPPEEAKALARKIKKQGAFTEAAAIIKENVTVPVITVGRMDPALGEWLLEKGKADLIAFARRLIADPELPNKVASGRIEDIAPCTACLTCFDHFVKGEPVRCRINPSFGKEQEYEIKPATLRKKVMVIGGGPAGMEAARSAALRGHEVTIYEEKPRLGGLLWVAALVKGHKIEDLPGIVKYLQTQLTKLGVRVELMKEADLALVEKLKPEAVILATGPRFTGSDKKIRASNVMTCGDLYKRARPFLRFFSPGLIEYLSRFWIPIGKQVLIMGGKIQGCQLAEFLIKRKRTVTILEESDALGAGMPEINRARLLGWLSRKGVTTLTGVKFGEITDDGLNLTTKGGEQIVLKADTIVLVGNLEPDDSVLKGLEEKVPELHRISYENTQLIVDAIEAGARAGRSV
jgi:2,4-dienoyl-CoA reductase (NADPH2)